MHHLIRTACLASSFCWLAACGSTDSEPVTSTTAEDDSDENGDGTDGDDQTSDEYDTELLNEFRAAIPSQERVQAPRPGTEPDPNALTSQGTAELAKLAVVTATAINAPAIATVVTLKALTKVPPTLYDSEKQQFVWGPFDNDDAHGKVLAYIQKNEADADFEYTYALVRLEGNDIATGVPVIWGGATPLPEPDEDGDESGVGVTLWDFEANRAFDEAHDPDFSAEDPVDRGRFVMLFGREDSETGRFKYNLAVFRDFVGKDADTPEPANLDYFYGHYRGADDLVVDFVDWKLDADLCDTAAESCFENKSAQTNAAEELLFRAAFVNRGVGRATAKVSGGDLSARVAVDECWNATIDRSYVQLVVDDESLIEEGACQSPFDQTLDELDIPTLDDVDPALIERMSCVAESGAACGP